MDDAVEALITAITTFNEAIVADFEVVKTALTEAIKTAENLLEDTKTGTAPGQVSEDAKTALTEAITTAQGVADNSEATQQELEVAVQALNTAITTFNKAIVKETITYSVGNGANAKGIVLTFSESIGPNGPIDLSGVGGTVADATAVISGEADAAGTILTISSPIGAKDGETVKIPLTIGEELVTVTLEWDADKSVWTLTTDPVDVLKEVTSKLQGTLKDEDGVAVSNGEIVIINVKDQSRFTVALDENGEFPLSLDDGEYKVTAIKSG